jgi:hypothetical protein
VSLPKRAPAGPGVWIWQIHKTDHGDLGAITDRLQRVRVPWVLLKTGDTQRPWPNNPMYRGWEPLARALRGAGIGVYGWAYLSAYSARGDARVIRDSLKTGLLDGYVLDVEGPQERDDAPAIATAIMGDVRAAEPDAWIGLCPFFNPASHGRLPHREYMRHCDAFMGQAYWDTLQLPPEWVVEQNVREVSALHRRWADTRGCRIEPAGQMHHMPPEEIRRFLALDACRAACSLWVYEYARQEHWDALAAHLAGEPAPAAPLVVTVREMQAALTALGYDAGVVDGAIGPKTRAALKRFQLAHDLTADARPGNQSLGALRRELAARGITALAA